MTIDEQRSPDQDAAIEAAFVAGTLPEEDRRRDEALAAVVAENAALKAELVAAHAAHSDVAAELTAGRAWISELEDRGMEVDATASILEKAGLGSIFTKESHGWTVKYVDGGTVITVQGPTIPDALASHGQQVNHFPEPVEVAE